MKQCRACKKEIDDGASKCPYCQSFQRWHRDPQTYAFVFMVALFGFLYLMHENQSKSYTKYQDKFVIEKVSQILADNKKMDIFTYRIVNKTKICWRNVQYQMLGTNDKGAVVYTDSGWEYGWIVKPDSEAFLTVMCQKNAQVRKWELKIVNMESCES